MGPRSARRATVLALLAPAILSCSLQQGSCSCPSAAFGLAVNLHDFVAQHPGTTAFKVCERGKCFHQRIDTRHEDLFYDAAPATNGDPLALTIQLQDTRGRLTGQSTTTAAAHKDVVHCCGSVTTSWLFVGQVGADGKLRLRA